MEKGIIEMMIFIQIITFSVKKVLQDYFFRFMGMLF